MISKNAEYTTAFDAVKTDGTEDTSTTPTITVSKDGGNFASASNSPTRIQTTNVFTIVLTATEMNADLVVVKITGTGLIPRTIILHPETVWTSSKSVFLDAPISDIPTEQILIV